MSANKVSDPINLNVLCNKYIIHINNEKYFLYEYHHEFLDYIIRDSNFNLIERNSEIFKTIGKAFTDSSPE